MSDDQNMFASVIEQHLALKRKNSVLEGEMPLQEFIPADPMDNHALFKSEVDARREEQDTGAHPAVRLDWDLDESAEPEAETSWADTKSTPSFDWDS